MDASSVLMLLRLGQAVGRERVDVDIAIRYSDVQLCTITLAKPKGGEALFQIVTKTAGIPQSLVEAFQETRRLFACEPWPDR